jgi:predicted phosphate transport protein (TIGR00153 family)
MVMPRLRLLPQQNEFFELFNRSAQNLLEGARLLVDLLEHYQDVDRKTRRIRDIEQTGVEITHGIMRALGKTFITPLDREDINELASSLDELLDRIEECARRMRLYKVKRAPKLAQQMGRMILEQVEQIAAAIAFVERHEYGPNLERTVDEVRRLENEADDMLGDAVAALYDDVTDIPAMIAASRLEKVYELLEETSDKAEDVAHTLHLIAIKYS